MPWRLGIDAAQLRPIDRIAGLGAPLLLIAGAEDRHTPEAESRRLYAAAAQPKQLWMIPGAAHVDLHGFAPAAYEARVGQFLSTHLHRVTEELPLR